MCAITSMEGLLCGLLVGGVILMLQVIWCPVAKPVLIHGIM